MILPSKPATRAVATRSTEVVELARQRLSDSAYRALRSVSCQCHEGVITLTGRVTSYYLKQVAQEIVGSLEQVGGVENRLEVVESRAWPT